jgi:cell division protein FtsL
VSGSRREQLSGLETILISIASFVVGAVVGVITFAVFFAQQFVQKTACEAERRGCSHRVEIERKEIAQLAGEVKELNRWIRILADKMEVKMVDR